jgi:hypothetical protein
MAAVYAADGFRSRARKLFSSAASELALPTRYYAKKRTASWSDVQHAKRLPLV